MTRLDLSSHSHRRRNALTGEWVLVSPHRATRPWQGQTERAAAASFPQYDRDCYMCPGNTRANGGVNPRYASTFVFDNDFPALTQDAPRHEIDHSALLVAHGETGICRVVCFSPRHDLTLARMGHSDIRGVIDTWAEERGRLAARPDISYVQIFENCGAIVGASNPHPHGQIWASASVPPEVQKEQEHQRSHLESFGNDLLGDYLDLEISLTTRVVCDNAGFVALVPFWAVWPFETMIVPRRRVATIDDFTADERDLLANISKRLLTRYDNLFHSPFPYSMGFHESPADEAPHPEWRWHAHFYPPLLRSATVRKFMVGYEQLAMPQRDLPPEEAAGRLRAGSEQDQA